jgi:hypothetical protein
MLEWVRFFFCSADTVRQPRRLPEASHKLGKAEFKAAPFVVVFGLGGPGLVRHFGST